MYLSAPDVGPRERALLLDAFESGWIAPLGPHVDAFEVEIATAAGVGHAAALSSGTAALHLALLLLGVGPGDEVLVPTLTFGATANAVRYVGARPVFVDCDLATWQIDPSLVAEALGGGPGRFSAAIAVDLYGQCADYEALGAVVDPQGVPLVEDAAEALGATYGGRPAGSFGVMAALSFNGNKIITTSGGGMLLSDRGDWIQRARFLATPARDPAPHYEHSTVGFNYRMSNLLAALGRAQLESLGAKVAARQRVNAFYRRSLGDLPGRAFMPAAGYGEPTWWLTCVTIDPAAFGATREDVRLALEAEDIEARPVWKPMHLQPVWAECSVIGGSVAAGLFEHGLCLPSSSFLESSDLDRVAAVVRGACPAVR